MIIIGQVSSIERMESTFEVVNKAGLEDRKNFAIYPEDSLLAITSKDRHSIVEVDYGLIPFWTKNSQKIFEAPIEGKTKSDETSKLKKGIINEPAFRKPIRELRSIIPVDYFILHEGEKSMLFFNVHRPFALSGLIDFWKPTITEKNLYSGVSILTLPAKGIYKDCGFTRQPMIVEEKSWKYWLRDISLTEVTSLIDYSSDKLINGYQVDTTLILLHTKDKSVIEQKGIFLKDNVKMNTKEKIREKFRKGGKHSNNEQEQRIWKES